MKKTLAIVMALAMALGMIASFAFVVAPTTTSRTNAPIGIDMWATDAMATTQGTRIWTDFVDKSEDLYAKSSLIYFVMQIRAYNSVQNADVVPTSTVKTMKVDLSSQTVDLSLANINGGTVFTKPSPITAGTLFGGSLRAVDSVDATGLFTLKNANIPNVYTFDIQYRNTNSASQTPNPAGHTIGIDILEGTAAAGVPAYTDVYVGFVGLTKNEITAKGSVVASVNYDGSSEKFHPNGNTDATVDITTAAQGDWLTVTKGERTYLIVRNAAASWAAKTSYVPSYATIGAPIGYAVFVKVAANGIYNYVCQLDTEVTSIEGYGQSLGISVDRNLLNNNNTTTNFGFGAVLGEFAAAKTDTLVKVLPYTFLTTKYVYAEDKADVKAGQDAFTAAQLATFETFMSDFGFSAANTYKLQDKDFTVTGAYQATITAEYNGGQVVAIEPEEDDSEIVDEPTDEEPEIEEEPDVDEEPEVPAETGDFSSDVAIVLAVSALAAAAALAFVMKKVRD